MIEVAEKIEETIRRVPGYDPYRDADGFEFDATKAETAIDFFEECLTHIEGKLAGQPFLLEPWQKAIIGNIFGWKRPDGTRRYREAMIYVPRKNGKTPLAAGIANYVLFCDDEQGQQNLCAAAEREQASFLFRHARGMVENEPELSRRAKIYAGLGQRSIAIESENSSFKVISADADTKHGGNLHLAIVDELHVQPNRDLVDVIQTSMASKNRRQPLLIFITTADFDRESICNEKHDYACKVRDGIIKDPAFFPVIYEADQKDDWTSPAVWARANPNYGVSVSEEYMARECKHAQESPAYENTFKRLHMNIKTQTNSKWIDIPKWDASAGPETWEQLSELLKGRECVGALDIGSTSDLTALCLLFRDTDLWQAIWRFWVPEGTAEIRERRARVPYQTWAKQGLITLTPGNETDYSFVLRDINQLCGTYPMTEIAVDRLFQGAQLSQDLAKAGMNVVTFGMGYMSMGAPTKEFYRLVNRGEIHHGGNPVMRWMASNAVVEEDAAGNIKPAKNKSTEKIDGVVTLIMALGRAMVAQPNSTTYFRASAQI